jgi:hypothetical protein
MKILFIIGCWLVAVFLYCVWNYAAHKGEKDDD